MIRCSGDGRKEGDGGEDERGTAEGGSNTGCCASGHGSGDAGYGGDGGLVMMESEGNRYSFLLWPH